ncbi:hypothetical protein [Frankia sp. AgB32]|uniref:hypothetical protein n=1 Tax=Frankia sp. AgB32 TaxID=631119 RepID=UPI00200F477E|nr:hypothetical protein [Frankia sp. AgB32]MCK9894850.1 hypothetical protein [Frankia sp. AgB32]
MSVIRVEPRGGRDFEVTVAEETSPGVPGLSFTYQVRVDDKVLAATGIAVEDEPGQIALVRASFEYLLTRESARSILRSFELSTISRYFPTYPADIAGRVSR